MLRRNRVDIITIPCKCWTGFGSLLGYRNGMLINEPFHVFFFFIMWFLNRCHSDYLITRSNISGLFDNLGHTVDLIICLKKLMVIWLYCSKTIALIWLFKSPLEPLSPHIIREMHVLISKPTTTCTCTCNAIAILNK